MRELIDAIALKHEAYGIVLNEPATDLEIAYFEKHIAFPLPPDFRKFYSLCNGFGCTQDIFNMVSLSSILEHPQDCGVNWFYFAEYMIYSDMWGLRFTEPERYEIFNAQNPEITLCTSLTAFLSRYLSGNLFDMGGLYSWHHELGIR